MRALLRRRVEAEPTILRIADLALDPGPRTIGHAGGRTDRFDPTRIRPPRLLQLRHPGRVLTRTMIAEHVWDYSFDTSTNVIDVYVNYLRKKVDADREPELLRTIRGSAMY